MPERNMRRYSQGNTECLRGKCVTIDIANIELLLLEQQCIFSRMLRGPVCCRKEV